MAITVLEKLLQGLHHAPPRGQQPKARARA
jgi:hypothetical protein